MLCLVCRWGIDLSCGFVKISIVPRQAIEQADRDGA